MRRSQRRPDPRPRPLAQRTSSAVATPAPESPAIAPKCSANSAIGSTSMKPSPASGSVIARRRTNTDAKSSAAVTRMLALCGRSARVVRDSWTSASSRWGCGAPAPRPRVNATPPGRGVGRGVIAPAEDGAISPCRVRVDARASNPSRAGQEPDRRPSRSGRSRGRGARPASKLIVLHTDHKEASVTVPHAPGNASATCATAGRFRPSASSRFLLFAQRQVASLRGRGATSFTVGTGHLLGACSWTVRSETTRS